MTPPSVLQWTSCRSPFPGMGQCRQTVQNPVVEIRVPRRTDKKHDLWPIEMEASYSEMPAPPVRETSHDREKIFLFASRSRSASISRMKEVVYRANDRWVGTLCCPACKYVARAWKSSGMSECRPHFYCDHCSNAIFRETDQAISWNEQSAAVLATIASTLPSCPCGGRFAPGANPKCPGCGAPFAHQNDPVTRLSDPHVILLDGACFFGQGEPYRVKIIE